MEGAECGLAAVVGGVSSRVCVCVCVSVCACVCACVYRGGFLAGMGKLDFYFFFQGMQENWRWGCWVHKQHLTVFYMFKVQGMKMFLNTFPSALFLSVLLNVSLPSFSLSVCF